MYKTNIRVADRRRSEKKEAIREKTKKEKI